MGATALIILPAFSQSALAQTPTDRDFTDVVVTGQALYSDQVNALRSPTPIIDVPQSLSIVTADQILVQGFNSIGDIIDYTPGVNNTQGEGHRDAVVFRGVRSTADFFIDGVRDDVQYYRPLYNLEQVEVLRGPNALLFGRGGTGGILNRVTKKAKIDERFNGYQASVDTFGAHGLQLDGNFDTSDKSAVRVNAFYESLENHRDLFDGKQIGFTPTAKFQLSPDTVLDVSYEYANHKRFIDRGIPTGADGRPVEALKDIVFGVDGVNKTALKAHIYRGVLQHKFSEDLKGNLTVSYNDFDKSYENLYAQSYNELVTPDEVTLDGYLDTTSRQSLTLSGNLIGELIFGNTVHTLIGGVEYIDTNSNQDRLNPVWSTNPTSTNGRETFALTRPIDISATADGTPVTFAYSDVNDDTRADLAVFSAYVQDEIALSDQLDIILGARFDSFDLDVLNAETDVSEGRKDEEISPRLGLVYKPVENISFYGSYSESFLPRSGEQYANLGDAPQRLDPDTFTNLEAGLKWNMASGLSLTAAIFEIEKESAEVDSTDSELLEVIQSDIQGFEAQLAGQITEPWFISASYSYLDGTQADSDLRPRELPENTASIWNNYRVNDVFGLGFGLTYQDETFINNSNSAILPSYTRVDAAMFYDVTPDLRVQLNVENLTDALYFPSSHSTHQATVAAPLNARLTLSGQF